MYVDMRAIDRITPTDSFPLPRIKDLIGELNQHKIFSTLDLKSGYWQIKLHPNSISKSAFLRLPFGLKNDPADFQRIMQIVLGGLSYVQVYINDIVIYSKKLDEHFLHLEEVFMRLKNSRLKLNKGKCVFFASKIQLLGHIVSGTGIEMEPVKVESHQY